MFKENLEFSNLCSCYHFIIASLCICDLLFEIIANLCKLALWNLRTAFQTRNRMSKAKTITVIIVPYVLPKYDALIKNCSFVVNSPVVVNPQELVPTFQINQKSISVLRKKNIKRSFIKFPTMLLLVYGVWTKGMTPL